MPLILVSGGPQGDGGVTARYEHLLLVKLSLFYSILLIGICSLMSHLFIIFVNFSFSFLGLFMCQEIHTESQLHIMLKM